MPVSFNALYSVMKELFSVPSRQMKHSLVHWNTEMEARGSKTLLLKVRMSCEWIMLHVCVHKTEYDVL